jgi:hypothetical protein
MGDYQSLCHAEKSDGMAESSGLESKNLSGKRSGDWQIGIFGQIIYYL